MGYESIKQKAAAIIQKININCNQLFGGCLNDSLLLDLTVLSTSFFFQPSFASERI